MKKSEEMIAANPALKDAVGRGILRPPLIEEGPIPEGQRVASLAELLRDLDEVRADRAGGKRMDCDSHEVAP